MTLASETRAAIRRRPFLREALRAGVVNYAAAARVLDVNGEESAVVAALRRYAETLPEYDETLREARVTMRSSLGFCEHAIENENGAAATTGDDETAALLRVGDRALVSGTGTLTAVFATGELDTAVLAHVLSRLDTEDLRPVAAGAAGDSLVVVVSREEGPATVQAIEDALRRCPSRSRDSMG